MSIPLQVFFHEMPKSDPLEAEIRKRVDKLEPFSRQISLCRVAIGPDGPHQPKGMEYEVLVDLTLTGSQVSAGHGKHQEDVFIAVRDAFDVIHEKLGQIMPHHKEAA